MATVMSSGRRESIMMFCASPFSRVYLAPIEHYGPDAVHVFISDRDDPMSSVEREAYESSKGEILCADIVEHRMNTSDYNSVLGEIIETVTGLRRRYGDDLDIFINISSGTPEFAAAGMFASMLPLSVTSFRTDVSSSKTTEELTRIVRDLDGSLDVSEPEKVTGLKNDRPEDEMIEFLTIVNDLLRNTRYVKYRSIIERLKDADAWSYDPGRKIGYGRTSLEEREERYLKRHYISIALENGWLEKPSPNVMRLTDSGRAYISVYGAESDIEEMADTRVLCSMPMRNEGFNDECPRETIVEPCMEDVMPWKSSTVTYGYGRKRHTFTIGMDQHR